jgi:uncharacterized protein HemX
LKRLPDYNESLAALINKSREQVAYLQKRERTRRRVLMGITIAALIGLGIAVWFYFDAQKSRIAADNSKIAAEQALTDFKTAENKRLTLEFTQLLDNIENNIIPANDACPDADMLTRIKEMRANPRTEVALQTRIDVLSQQIKDKGCDDR